MIQLNEYDKLEWLDVAKVLKPSLTNKEYEEMWEEFVAFKKAYLAKLKIN